MTPWEYKLDELGEGEHDGDDYVPYLNAQGQQGWQLCTITHGGGVLSIHWKRPLPERVELAPGATPVSQTILDDRR